MVKPEAKRPLGRPRHRWEDNIIMDLQEVGWGINWIDLAQDRDSCECDDEAPGSLKCCDFRTG